MGRQSKEQMEKLMQALSEKYERLTEEVNQYALEDDGIGMPGKYVFCKSFDGKILKAFDGIIESVEMSVEFQPNNKKVFIKTSINVSKGGIPNHIHHLINEKRFDHPVEADIFISAIAYEINSFWKELRKRIEVFGNIST